MIASVLIVGAGPVGLTTALELARYGVPVRVVDRNAARTDKSKALVVWTRTLELLEPVGCAAEMVAAGNRVLRANILSGKGLLGGVDLTHVQSRYAFALMLPQSETERILEEALARLGVRVERRVECAGFTQGERGVVATLRHADGREETASADWLIGCDGAGSQIRHAVGASFDGATEPHEWILADVHVAGLPFPISEIATYLGAEGPVVFLPISEGRYRIIADHGRTADGAAGPARVPALDEVRAVIAARVPGAPTLSDPIWLSGFHINERQADRYRFGRVFLAGDAAHIHSPAGGQGMNTGMQDAFNLGWKLALVCRGLSDAPALLDSYESERHPVARQVIADTAHLTRAATLENPLVRGLRDFAAHLLLGVPAVQDAVGAKMTQMGVHYAASPLDGPRAGGPRPGDRVPPARDAPPYGAGDTPRFAVLGEDDGGFAALAARHGALLEPAPRAAPEGETGLRLVRPDGYLAMTAKGGDWTGIADYLARFAPGGAAPAS